MAVKEDEITNRDYRKRTELGRILVKEDVQARIKLVTSILRKDVAERTPCDQQLLDQTPEIVHEVLLRLKKRDTIKERAKEVEDPESVLKEKCRMLADAIRHSKCAVVYTGAGISTEASIPDYRGPNGVWTLLQKGQPLRSHNLSDAEPTVTHMALYELHKRRHVSHVVSQNCDGLHLRSGISRKSLSEVHGNMYIEVCKGCKPPREYVRLLDVTERTSLHRHRTGRKCTTCGHDLIDTIVHFGERGTLKSPLNWTKAISMAKNCDIILCIGSSLKVLRKYTCLWSMSRPPQNRPKLFIVNLQWTPKDTGATLKINGRCDVVMTEVMCNLGLQIPKYKKDHDPLFKLAIRLTEEELMGTTRKELEFTENVSVTRRQVKSGQGMGTIQDVIAAGPSVQHAANNETWATQPLDATSDCDISSIDEKCDNMEDKVNLPADVRKESKVNAGCSQTMRCKKYSGEESVDKVDLLTPDSTPGWFGKGYRKSIKKRKRTN